jgi:hypothetical protein
MSCKPSAKKAFESTDKFLSPILKRGMETYQVEFKSVLMMPQMLSSNGMEDLLSKNLAALCGLKKSMSYKKGT